MPPRKSKAQVTSSSQPLPDKPTRASRKRRHSDASNAESVASQQSTTAPVKRAKRGRPAKSKSVEAEVIEEEDDEEEELNAHHQLTQGGDATDERVAVTETIEVSQPRSKHVHFGGPAEEGEDEMTTATNITPHPRSKTIKRRFSSSPGANTKRARATTTTRISLPASFSQEEDGSQESTGGHRIIQELQFAPLRAVLDERIRRRLRRSHLSEEQNEIEDHAKRDSRTAEELQQLRAEGEEKERRIEELEFDLEAQRQAAIDITDTIPLEQELAQLRGELAEHMSTHRLNGPADSDILDGDMMVLDSQEEVVDDVAYPQLPGTPHDFTFRTNGERSSTHTDAKTTFHEITETTGRSSTSDTIAKLRNDWDEERLTFENAILELSKDASDARGRLRILEIELRNLGLGGEEVSTAAIIQSIRDSFTAIHTSLRDILPDSLPDDASVTDIVEILIANVREFANRLRMQDRELHEKSTLIADLGNQIHGLLDHLAAAEIRKKELEKSFETLDRENDEKARTIEELEEELNEVTADRDELTTQLEEKVVEAKTLGEDHANSIRNLEKLTLSLEQYRLEETRLTELITRMEEEHREDVKKMNIEREQTVQDYEDRLDAEIELRKEAEAQNDERQGTITQMEIKVEQLSTERDSLTEELENAKAELDDETNGRQTAEATLEDKTVEIEDLTARVDRLEEELTLLNTHLTELRRLNESERHQREAAETDLDDRNAEIADLKLKLEHSGKEANELRFKMHNVQQENAARVLELEQQMSERDERFQEDIAAEVGRREEADGLAQQRAATILDLEGRIEEIELRMRADLEARDERIQSLEDELVEKNTEIESLKMDLRSAENELDIERSQNEQKVEELEGSILALQATQTELETTIQGLQTEAQSAAELHDSETEDRNAQIADLHAQVANLSVRIEDLQREKGGLEERVTQEAEAMLEMQAANQDEIDDLKAQLTDKQEKILVVEQKAVEADRQWVEVLKARDQEILELKAGGEEQTEVLTTVTTNAEAIRTAFRAYVARTNGALAHLEEQLAAFRKAADEESEGLRADGDAALEEIEGLDLVGKLEVRRTTTTKAFGQSQSQSSSGAVKKGRGRKSKRGMDSGIGMEGEAEEEMA